MATQLLFYEAAVPVTAARHGNWSIEARDYSFSKGINSVPLTTVEFQPAAAEYAIVFTGEPGALMPAAVLGVRSAENLYLKSHGDWDASYVPAFVRRYPFVFSSPDRGKNFTLCIDETFSGFNQEGRGQRLFGEDSKASTYTGNVLGFLKQYQIEFQRTQAFCRKLEELQLFAPMQAQIKLASGGRMALAGFLAIDRAKLKALSPAQLAELVQNDGLELVYLHLQSLRNFTQMGVRLDGAAAMPAKAETASAAIAEPVTEAVAEAVAEAEIETEAVTEAEAEAPVAKARPTTRSRKKQEGKLSS
jgi:hypothetical protein